MEIVLYILMFLVGIIGVYIEHKKHRFPHFMYILFSFLFIYIACIRINTKLYIGTDFEAYIDYFLDDYDTYFEPGYVALTYIVKLLFGHSTYALIAIVCLWILLFAFLSTKICITYIKNDIQLLSYFPYHSCLFCFTYLACIFWGNYFVWMTLRIGLATSLLYCSSAFFINGKFKYSIAIAILSVLFHYSCIIFVLGLLLLRLLKDIKIQYYLYWLVAIIIGRFIFSHFSVIIESVTYFLQFDFLSRYTGYVEPKSYSELGFFSAQNIFNHLSGLLMLKGNLEDSRYNKSVKLFYFGLTLGVFFQFTVISSRIQNLFLSMIIFPLLYFLLDRHYTIRNKILVLLSYSFFEIIVAVRQFGWYI